MKLKNPFSKKPIDDGKKVVFVATSKLNLINRLFLIFILGATHIFFMGKHQTSTPIAIFNFVFVTAMCFRLIPLAHVDRIVVDKKEEKESEKTS